jgi:hypothetical protein
MASVLTSQEENFPRWYQEVIAKAQLAENGPVRGTMVIRPWGYAIWERLQAAIDERIKAAGAGNAYFPLLIPEAFLAVARIAWQACGPDGEDQLAQAGISVRCLVREDAQPVDDPSADGVDALLARAY